VTRSLRGTARRAPVGGPGPSAPGSTTVPLRGAAHH
jgi:hypothetical protein